MSWGDRGGWAVGVGIGAYIAGKGYKIGEGLNYASMITDLRKASLSCVLHKVFSSRKWPESV